MLDGFDGDAQLRALPFCGHRSLRDGTRHGIEVDRSEIARYLHPADADIEAKFRSIAVPVLGEAKVAEVVALVRGLEGMVNVEALIEALQP